MPFSGVVALVVAAEAVVSVGVVAVAIKQKNTFVYSTTLNSDKK